MPTFYVEDYDGDRNDDAVEPLTLAPVADDGVQAKVVEPESQPRSAKKTSRAKTKG
jgi:hypothetical protein